MDEKYDGYTNDMQRVAAARVALENDGFNPDELDDEANELIMCEDIGFGIIKAINNAIDRGDGVHPHRIAKAIALAVSSAIGIAIGGQDLEHKAQGQLAMLCKVKNSIDAEILNAVLGMSDRPTQSDAPDVTVDQ